MESLNKLLNLFKEYTKKFLTLKYVKPIAVYFYINRKNIIPIIGIMSLAIFLRIWNLGGEGLRLDESQSVWQASHTMSYIKDYMIRNVHLPLHNTSLHWWMRIFGNDEATVRMMAVIPGILCIPALYLLSKELFEDKEKARFSMLIGTVSPFWVWYSREIRMYSLLALITTLSYYAFVKAIKTDKTRFYILYFLVNLIGIYTHYYFMLVLGIQVLFFFISLNSNWAPKKLKKQKVRMLAKLVMVGVGIVLAFTPWIYALLSVSSSGSFAPELAAPDAFNMFISYFQFVFGFQHTHITALTLGFWPLILLVSFVFLTKRRSPFSYSVVLIVLGTFLPVILIFTISVLYKPMYLTRYLTPVTPMLYLLVTWFIYESKGSLRKSLTLVLILGMLLGLFNQFHDKRNPVREDYRAATNYINARVTPRDIVLLSPPYNIYPFSYYYTGNAQVESMPLWDKREGRIPTATPEILERDLNKVKDGHLKMYLLISENLENTSEVKAYMDRKYTKLDKVEFSKDLWVHVYQAEYL